MTTAVICWHPSFPAIALYDAKLKKILSVYKLKQDYFVNSLIYLVQNSNKYSCFFVTFGIQRFSQTRQVTLLANVLAQAYQYKTTYLAPQASINSSGDLQKLINQKFDSVQWTRLITPVYAKDPHITKRKKRT